VPAYPGVRVARLETAALAVHWQVLRPFTREALADLRDGVTTLDATERQDVIGFLPDAQSPRVVVTDADAAPPPGSPYAAWPIELRRTLARSFQQRRVVTAGSRRNLDNAFWGGLPGSLWDGLDRIAQSDRNTLLSNYQRAVAAGFPWPEVDSIQNIWTGTSSGLGFVPGNAGAIRSFLIASQRFCHDSWLSGSEHSGSECWREVIYDAPGLHVCLGASEASSMHIDAHQVVKERGADGVCDVSYVTRAGRNHGSDLGWWF